MKPVTSAASLFEVKSAQGLILGMMLGSVFIFSCFFPYPALAIGSSTGLQASQLFALLMIPLIFSKAFPRRAVICFWVILTPLTLSTTVLSLLGLIDSADLAVKNILNLILSVLVILPASWVLLRYGLKAVIIPASIATLIHAAAAGWQLIAFASGSFPFLAIYANPSFANVAEVAQQIVLYDPRPFGLFPEPSAMAASLGPWLVLFIAIGIQPQKFRVGTRGVRLLVALAGVSGLVLIIVSRSGYIIFLLGGLAVTGMAAFKGRMTSGTAGRNLLTAAASVTAASVIVYEAYSLTGTRLVLELGSATGTSYAQRFSSIVDGLSLVITDPVRIMLGVGSGQSVGALQHAFLGSNGAIYSDGVRYAIEAGLVGLFALFGICIFIVRMVIRSRARLTGLGCFLAWLGAVTLTTSYLSLSPIWAFLGVLLCWDLVFPIAQKIGTSLGVTGLTNWSSSATELTS